MLEDQVIDLVIALESSLLMGDKSSSKQYRLAARGALLLTKDRATSETESFLRKMYQRRNDIVHGGKLLSELEEHPVEFTRQCESVVRDILKKYINRLAIGGHQSLQSVNDNLDKYYRIDNNKKKNVPSTIRYLDPQIAG